jgi:hypothetical protein
MAKKDGGSNDPVQPVELPVTHADNVDPKVAVKDEDEQIKYKDHILDHELYTNESGEEFIYVKGLLRIAWGYAGLTGWTTEVVQAPERKNGWSATVVVKCTFRVKEGSKYIKKFASGAADCRWTTAGDGFQNYTTALAETRALGRAIRRYLGINLCTFEEQHTPENHPITDNQRNCIEKKFLKPGLATLQDVSKLIERDVASLTELNGQEASEVIVKLNKALKKKQLAKKGADAAPAKTKKKAKKKVKKSE